MINQLGNAAEMAMQQMRGAQQAQFNHMNPAMLQNVAGRNVSNANNQQWEGGAIANNPFLLLNAFSNCRPATQEEVDFAEAMAEAEKVCKEVKDWFELCDWVAENEVNAIAPGLVE